MYFSTNVICIMVILSFIEFYVIHGVYHLPKEVSIQSIWDQGVTTYAMNTTEYVNRLCNKNLSTYSEMDCKKVNSDEQRLLRQLMRNYEREVRPVVNSSLIVVVKLGLTLTQIFDLAEKNQILISNVWLDIEWSDEFLKWDPNEFNGLKILRVPSKKLWLPDLVLYNNAAEYLNYRLDTNAMVSSDGKVFWPVPTKLQSTCKFDVSFFPFDIQTCYIKIGSWTYDGFQVDVTNRTENIDLSNYVPNGEWELIKTTLIRNVVYYPCCPEPFPDVTFILKIRRRVLFFMINVIIPCIMLSALTLLVFVIPPDSGDKVTLGITVLLAFSVFMLAVAENLPETSEYVPLISIYLTVIMGITSLSVICTVLVLNLYNRGPNTDEVPAWLRRLVLNDTSSSKSTSSKSSTISGDTHSDLFTANGNKQTKCNGLDANSFANPTKTINVQDNNNIKYFFKCFNKSPSHSGAGSSSCSSCSTSSRANKTKANQHHYHPATASEPKFPIDINTASTYKQDVQNEKLFLTENRKSNISLMAKTTALNPTVTTTTANKNNARKNKLSNNVLLVDSFESNVHNLKQSFESSLEDLRENQLYDNDEGNSSVYEFVNMYSTRQPLPTTEYQSSTAEVKSSTHVDARRRVKTHKRPIVSNYANNSNYYATVNTRASTNSGATVTNSTKFYSLFQDSIRSLKKTNDKEKIEKRKIEEWKLVASFFDKLFFWIFFIFTLIFSLVCLVVVPIYQYVKNY